MKGVANIFVLEDKFYVFVCKYLVNEIKTNKTLYSICDCENLY